MQPMSQKFNSAFNTLPESIQNLLKLGIERANPKRVILFGSRARGDHRENSDFDVVFQSLEMPEQWSRFMAEYQEEPITLHKVDLLIYENASPDYRKNIDREGVILYER